MTDPRIAPAAARFGDAADLYERARPGYPEDRAVVLERVAAFLAQHPDTAGRTELTYERPSVLHLCRRLAT